MAKEMVKGRYKFYKMGFQAFVLSIYHEETGWTPKGHHDKLELILD